MVPVAEERNIAREVFKGRNVVCFSTADWDTLLPTNKHHLMRRLAGLGARVLFLETLGTRAPKLSSGTDLARIGRRLSRSFEGPRKREKRLWTVSPLVRPSWSTRSQIALNQAAFRLQLGRHLARFKNPIAWVYSPYAAHLVDSIQPSFVVYHMVDDLSAVPGADAEAIREAEARMLDRADVVFCTERSLYDRARRVSKNCHYMPNVADFAHFSRPGDVKESAARLAHIQSLGAPRLLFSGNITPHKVDLALLVELARAHKNWQLVLVGPEWEGQRADRHLEQLRRQKNVTFVGHVPYDELPAFLHAADVLLIPYLLNDATRAVFPLKLFEYLSTGKPVVASPLPSLIPYSSAVRIAESIDDWTHQIMTALADTHELELQRRHLAKRHTWDRRIEEMARAVGG